MKKCPYCAEEIQDEAIVCRCCGRDLPQVETEIIDGQSAAENDDQPAANVAESNNAAILPLLIILVIAGLVIAFGLPHNSGGGSSNINRSKPSSSSASSSSGLPDYLYTHCFGPNVGIPLWAEPGSKEIVGRVAVCGDVTPFEKTTYAGDTWWLVRGETPAGERGQRGWVQSGWVFEKENDPGRYQ